MINDDNHNGNRATDLSRRRILALSGVGLATGLAGCSDGDSETNADGSDGSSSDDGGSDTTQDWGGTPLDAAFTTSQPATLPPDIQFNPYNQNGGFPRDGQHFEFVSMAAMLTKTQEEYPIALSDYSLDGKTATIELNDWFTWSNGEDVTAKDLETQFILAREMGYPYVDEDTEVQQTGDYTVELTLDSEVNPQIYWAGFFKFGAVRPRRIHTPHSEFKQYREMFEDATTDSARQDVVSELGTWQPEEPVGNGPYHLNPERTTEEKMVYERNDDYPVAKVQEQFAEELDYDVSMWPEENHIPEWEVVYSGERKTELILSDTLDSAGLTTITPELRNQSPEHMDFLSIPVFGGTNLVPNLGDDIFGRRRVRQAVAYLIPYDQAGQIMYGELSQPDTAQTSLPPSVAEAWLSDDFSDKLTQYELNREKAASLLREEGFSREDGTWYDENGDQIEGGSIPIPATLSQKVKAFNAIAQSLTDFGIKTDVATSDWSGWSDAMDKRDYKLAHSYMGGGPHPRSALTSAFGESWWKTNREFYEGKEITIPSIENSNGTMTVRPTELYDQLENNLSVSKQEELVQKLAWAFNQDLPFIGLTFKDAAQFRTDDHWQQPPRDDKMSRTPGARYLQMYAGLLQPKFEN